MSFCSIFKNFHKPIETKSLIQIARDIASDKYKLKIEKIRSLLKEGKTEEAQEMKKELPAFTPSAVFKKRRVKEEVEAYSSFVHLDFDKLTDEQIGKLRSAIKSCPYTHVYFVSPSGKGIKVFIEVNSGKEEHERAYRLVQAYYENLTGLKADPSCKDITRLCFMSYDPDIFRNLENKKFPVKGFEDLEAKSKTKPLSQLPQNQIDEQSIFKQQIEFTNRIKTYEVGSRNAYVYLLASNCKRAGLSEQITIELISRNFDLSQKEIEQTVKSAYKRGLEGQRGQREEFKVESSELKVGEGQISQREEFKVESSELKVREGQISQNGQREEFKVESSELKVGHAASCELRAVSDNNAKRQTSNAKSLTPNPLTPNPSLDDAEINLECPVMPTLPDEIFSTIPDFLKRATSVAKTKEQRDILLLGALTTLSVGLYRLAGKYDDNIVNPNLFLFISAPASAGKGIINHCRKLVLPIHNKLKEQTMLMQQLYKMELQEYRANKTKDASLEQPVKPPRRLLFIPANNSATGFLKSLFDSFQRGIIFEAEGDTLSKAFNTEYGDFSDSFRKAFQHESISFNRRTDEEYVEINRPCLSVLLSGTPKQIKVLIPSAENGLFSRFMFYVMNMNYEWNNVFYSLTEKGLELYFEELGSEFFSFYQELELLPSEISFTLTSDQEQRFNTFFEGIQKLYMAIQEEDIISSVRRLGLTAFRIMMTFSILRLMDKDWQTDLLVCEDIDFENTLKMITVLIQHSSFVLNQIAEEPKEIIAKSRREMLLALLPKEFSTQDCLAKARKLNIIERTAQRYINAFEKAGLILKSQHGQYSKVQTKSRE